MASAFPRVDPVDARCPRGTTCRCAQGGRFGFHGLFPPIAVDPGAHPPLPFFNLTRARVDPHTPPAQPTIPSPHDGPRPSPSVCPRGVSVITTRQIDGAGPTTPRSHRDTRGVRKRNVTPSTETAGNYFSQDQRERERAGKVRERKLLQRVAAY